MCRAWQLISLLATTAGLIVAEPVVLRAEEPPGLSRRFDWRSSPPLLTARDVDGWQWHSVKDPSIVRHEDRWHLFATVRGRDRSHAILYVSFADWEEAEQAPRRILPMHSGYFCAPQIFYFRPQKLWYLICQASNEAWGPPSYRAAYSTTADLSNPDSWTPLQPLFTPDPPDHKIGLDFWVICDDSHAHLFSTTNDGKMWRRQVPLAEFPRGWSAPRLALQDDIFEASHTYRLAGTSRFLTLIEAQNGQGWRYYKAYLADRLDGPWQPLAATREHAFASLANVLQPEPRWTDSISHGELIRSGSDETLTVDPSLRLGFIYQGVLDPDRRGKAYGDIPWRLGLLTPEISQD
jgi:hypothetical protein